MSSHLSCRGWYMEDADLSTIKDIMAIAEDMTLDNDVRFIALYVAMTSGKISWGKFEEVCIKLGLIKDMDKNLDMIDGMLSRR